MKKTIVLIILLIQASLSFAQDKNYDFLPKEVHLMNDEEMIANKTQFSADTPMFDTKGNHIEQTQINDLMSSGNFFPLIYGDKNHKVKAIVFRKTTKEEKEEMLKALQMTDPNANFVAGQQAKDFTAYDINGEKIVLSSLKGKIVVLNFWFPQCQPCVMEMPELNKLVEKYKKDGVVFISITFEKKDAVKKFLANRTFNYKHITDNEAILADYDVDSFPTHILIDQKGEIIERKIGNFISIVDAKIAMLLKK